MMGVKKRNYTGILTIATGNMHGGKEKKKKKKVSQRRRPMSVKFEPG